MEINFASRECNVKIVYYGPGLSGKTTNLEVIHQKAPEANRGKLTALATDLDRTLYFDYMPLELGKISGLTVRMRLFTVPGQVYYNSTRKIVLRCVDGVVFVADSQEKQKSANLESLENLKENLLEHGLNIEEIPLILQYNKRDLPNIMPIEVMDADLNFKLKAPNCPAIAPKGDGVFQCLKMIANLTMAKVEENIKSKPRGMTEKESHRIAPSIPKDKVSETVSFVPPKKKSDVEMTQRRTRFSITGKWKKEEKPEQVVETKPVVTTTPKEVLVDPSVTSHRLSFAHVEKKTMDTTGSTSRLSGTTSNKISGETSSFVKKREGTSSFARIEEKKNPPAQNERVGTSSFSRIEEKKNLPGERGGTSSFARIEEKKNSPEPGAANVAEEKKAFFPRQQEQKHPAMGDARENLFKDRLNKLEERREISFSRSFSDSPKPKIPGILPSPLQGQKSDKFSMPLFQGSLSNTGASSSPGQKESLRVSKENNPPSLSFGSFLERKKELKNQNQEEDKE